MLEQLPELFSLLPAYLGGHVLLSMATLIAAVAISVPLGIVSSRYPKAGEFAMAIAGIVQTLPSLALLAFIMLLLNGTTGFLPAFLALLLYSILPILANTVIGIRDIDPALKEAARGLGMNDFQALWWVELPLAAPIILGGIRTATVLIVGTATLAQPIGGVSLGNYIFAGIATMDNTRIAFGCVAAALLAIGLDQLVHLLEIAARQRNKRLACLAIVAMLLVIGIGAYEPITQKFGRSNRVVVAGGNFPEQYILSQVISQQLEAAGFRPDRRDAMGYGIMFNALRANEVDCMVTYTGDVWSLLMPQKTKGKEPPGRKQTLVDVSDFLENEFGVKCLGTLGFENAYALAVRESEKTKSITTIEELVKYGRQEKRRLVIGVDAAFLHRNEWKSLLKKYQINPEEIDIREGDASLMYPAVAGEKYDAIVAYSSDGQVKEYDLKLLIDNKEAFPPYDAILLASNDAVKRDGFLDALKPLLGMIGQEAMQEANRLVVNNKKGIRETGTWLREMIHAK